jgi:hypothetical protein
LRIKTTCDALLVSFASLPATKKPQNALADRADQTADTTTTSTPTTDRTTDRFKDMPPPVCSCGSLRRARRPKDLRGEDILELRGA